MSTFGGEYLYNLPAAALYEFSRVMDSLPDSDWLKFASQVMYDQTDLRLVKQSDRKTETLMHMWGCRNGTVGELLNILQHLNLLRPRDIILNCRCVPQSSSASPTSGARPQPDVTHISPPPSSLFTPDKDVTRTLSSPESKLLPKPGPPPPDLDSSCSCLQSTTTSKNLNSQESSDRHGDQLALCTSVMSWPFEEVQSGTANFSAARQIGEGGFGYVYRASMKNTEFAVKRLKEDSHMGWSVVKESFRTEVERLSKYRHPNIMELAGYSVGGASYCLIYVYMSNGSLEDRLHCQNGCALSWSQRVNVLLGCAKAIQYLHACSPALIHGDVKSSNILLGEHLEPKLGDFGLARLCRNPSKTPGKTSTVAQTSTVRGTLAYLPDEYVKDGSLSMEIDVYSFGVVLLEVLTGRRALETEGQSKASYLKDLVSEVEDDLKSSCKGRESRELAHSHAAENIWKKHLDPRLTTQSSSEPFGSQKVAQLACRCLDRRRKKRPPMTEVFQTLHDLHAGWKALGRSGLVRTPPVAPYLSCPKPLRSDNCMLDSLAHRFSNLGPQEDTYCCQINPSLSCPPAAKTQSEAPKSERSQGSWETHSSSFRAPCESDESQGFSQYFVAPCAQPAHPSRTSQQSPEGSRDFNGTQSSGFSAVRTTSSSISSDERVVINPVRQRFVEKMTLYEEGRLLTSDLLSSAHLSDGTRTTQTREPEESDEFASNMG